MRVVAGKYRGRQLFAPKGLPTRPTTDSAKESLFNILGNEYEWNNLRILDLCSGIGSISVEFLSRGVEEVISVDSNYNCIKFQKQTKKDWDISNWQIYRNDIFKAMKIVKGKFDIIFIDPPYDSDFFNKIPDSIFSCDLLADDGLLIIEHSKNTSFNDSRISETRKYGSVNFSFFKNK